MGNPGDRDRGLFRDWAARKQWVFGEKPDNGAAVTIERPEPEPEAPEETPSQPPTLEASAPAAAAVESRVDPVAAAPAAPVAKAPAPPAPVSAPPAVVATSAASWDPEPVARPAGTAPQRSSTTAPPTPGQLSHVNERGEARMVDVTQKSDTDREAVAEGYVTMQSSTLSLILGGALAKGDVLAVARVAGVMAAKRTSDLIPMCHPLPVTGVTIDLTPSGEGRLRIQATVRTTGKTGVEMEALTAVSVTALTVYDMAKAVDRGMRLEGIRLLSKTGGKSGDWQAR